MTQAQLIKERKVKRLAADKAKRQARKLREAERKARRKAKHEVRMAPKRALAAWADQVRSPGTCAVCGARPGPVVRNGVVRMTKPKDPKRKSREVWMHLHAHHILPKEYYKDFKFLPINGIVLCPLHHKYGIRSAHRNPVWFACWLRHNRPEQYRWAKENMGKEPSEGQ